jgi:hypothetical protein
MFDEVACNYQERKSKTQFITQTTSKGKKRKKKRMLTYAISTFVYLKKDAQIGFSDRGSVDRISLDRIS